MPFWIVIARHEAISNNDRCEIALTKKPRNEAPFGAFL